MATSEDLEHVCLPINLDAFVLNEAVCAGEASLIAPITQPNYVSLRLQNSQIQHDVLPHIDLHNARGALANPRVSKTFSTEFQDLDLEDPIVDPTTLTSVDRSRLGVYLHWTVPRGYRSGSSQAAKPDGSKSKETTNPNPKFPLVPNRWLIVRVLRDFSPREATPDRAAAWVIESDKLRKIEELDNTIDLQTDVTPFVAYSDDADTNVNILDNQAENYIGLKVPLAKWSETTKSGTAAKDRVKLTIMNSSNPLFADYAIHNPNVFSTKDNFQWKTDPDGTPHYLDTALCDYIVVGWHSDMVNDPLGTIKNKDNADDLRGRLTRFFCAAQAHSDGKDDDQTTDSANKTRVNSSNVTRLLCHSARYSVNFTTTKPKTPADDYAAYFTTSVDMEPVAIGTTPLDAVLAFLQAHQEDKDFEDNLFEDKSKNIKDKTKDATASSSTDKSNDKATDGSSTDKNGDKSKDSDKAPTGSEIAESIMALRELLYATEDDYNSRIKAADLVYAHNFARMPGGFTWHYDKKKEKDNGLQRPSEDPDKDGNSEVDYLNLLNQYQQVWDAADRKLNQLRWALFSEFFKYISDPSNQNADRLSLYKNRIPNLHKEAKALDDQRKSLEKKIEEAKSKVQARRVANDPFFKRTDPTLCLAGIDSGWDPRFLQNTPTRFFSKITAPGKADTSIVQKTIELIGKKLPSDLRSTIGKLVNEASGGYQEDLELFGHQEWTKQPFSPQFVEWEGIYYHIDEAQWSIELSKSALASSNHDHVTYVTTEQLATLPGARKDQRNISGRMLVLPQPSFALGAVVAQVLGATPVAELPTKPINLQLDEKRDEFKTSVNNLKFISGELTGLTDALLTMASGQHVKPNVRPQGLDPQPMKAAVQVGEDIGLVEDDFVLMGGETGRTPYGTLTNFAAINDRPFKPVQHGQFAITKLNIVDKFGQVISCPPPKRTARLEDPTKAPTPNFIHPCMSEQLIPSLKDGTLNTVYTTKETNDLSTKSGYPMTPFIQLTPSINQEARINATFLGKEKNKDAKNPTFWKPCNDWDNPIFGWLVVNYADSALQFFTGDGIFYTALEFGGPTGTIETKKWLPFDPPDKAEDQISDQLDALIKKMTGPGGKSYLLALWDLIRRAIPTMPFPPSDYAQYANAIVGKPLALVNVGWSLELAQPPFWPQHTLPRPPDVDGDPNKVDPLRTTAEEDMSDYTFPVKVGDADRPFDGVLAYWDSDNPTPTTEFKKIYTYFPDTEDDGIREEIVPTNFPQLTPYFISPDPEKNVFGTGFLEQHTDKLTVKTILMDPYTPIHLYSGILPIKTLQLPEWSMKQAMKNMTGVFVVGALLLTKDVPKIYDTAAPLKPDTWLSAQAKPAATPTQPPIQLPIAGGKGMWNWLQPYRWQPQKDADLVTRYNSLEVGQEDGHMRNEPGPYTFVEGFLQLARPLVVPKQTGFVPTPAPAGDRS